MSELEQYDTAGLRELAEKVAAASTLIDQLEGDILSRFHPTKKQWELLSAKQRFVMFSGSNQTSGKTTALKALFAYHLSGMYPRDAEGRLLWDGPVYERPITAAVGGETAQSTRDNIVSGEPQKPGIIGRKGERGKGFLPQQAVDDELVRGMSSGIPDQIDYFDVRWHRWDEGSRRYKWDGKSLSRCFVFAYSAGWQRLQGYTLDLIGLDEEPPYMVADEMRARTIKSNGRIIFTMTPLQGYTDLVDEVMRLSEEDPESCRIIYSGIDDCTYIDDELREQIRRTNEHSHLALPRLYGMPNAGEGMIYRTLDEQIVVDDFEIPGHWRRICGIDLPHTTGTFAAAWLAYDMETDTIYLYREFKSRAQKQQDGGRAIQIDALRRGDCDTIPVAWPHDAGRLSQGATIADFYRSQGIRMLPDYAHFTTIDGAKSNSVLAAIDEVANRMATGRFRVFRTCQQFLKEKNRYGANEKGLPKDKQDDHLIDAVHKAVMMLRYAETLSTALGRVDYRHLTQRAEFFGVN